MYLKENPQIKEEIDRKLREKLGISDGDVEETEDAPKSLFDEEQYTNLYLQLNLANILIGLIESDIHLIKLE